MVSGIKTYIFVNFRFGFGFGLHFLLTTLSHTLPEPSSTVFDSKIFFFRKGDKSARKLLIMADQTKIDQFINLTGVDADRARFYIESAGGNVEVFSYPLILNMNVLYVCIDFTI